MSRAPGARAELEAIFRESLAAVDGAAAVRRSVETRGERLCIDGRPLPAQGGVVLLAVGKAAGVMAAAFEERAGVALRAGLVVTKDGHGVPLSRSALREAAHPVPDPRCEGAAREALALVSGMAPGDVLCVLLSGGASSLLACPAGDLSLADLATTTGLLLEAGADIEETNAVRKHVSELAGGRLARRCTARRIELLALSDVPGDRVDVIGSGPLSADPSHHADALEVLERYGLRSRVPARVLSHLESGARGEIEETVKPGDPALRRVRTRLLGTNRMAVEAAREAALRRGLRVRVASEPLAGEAREAGRALVGLAARAGDPEPWLLVAGGETTVTVRGRGRGGRNQELALAAALELDGGPPIALLAAGTDGSDGPTDAAGAFADEGTVGRGRRRGADARAALAENDSYGFFRQEGGLFVTGPTGTNVMDLALLRVEPAGQRMAHPAPESR